MRLEKTKQFIYIYIGTTDDEIGDQNMIKPIVLLFTKLFIIMDILIKMKSYDKIVETSQSK